MFAWYNVYVIADVPNMEQRMQRDQKKNVMYNIMYDIMYMLLLSYLLYFFFIHGNLMYLSLFILPNKIQNY